MIKLLKLDTTLESTDYLEKRINDFIANIEKDYNIFNKEIKIEQGFIYVIINHSLNKMVY